MMEPQIGAYIVKVMKAREFTSNSDFFDTVLEACKHECKIVILKKAKENADIDVTKYLSGVISNVINSTLRELQKPSNYGVSFISLDDPVGDGHMTNAEVLTNTKEVNVFLDFVLGLKLKQNRSLVEEWLLLMLVDGYKQKEVAAMYGVSCAYVCKQVKKYCSDLKENTKI